MPTITPENILSSPKASAADEAPEPAFTWEPDSQLLRSADRRVALEAIVQDPKEPLNKGVVPWDWDAACTQIYHLKDPDFRRYLFTGAGLGAAVQAVMGDGALVDRVASGGLKGALLAGGISISAVMLNAWNARYVRNNRDRESCLDEAIAYASPVTKRMYDVDRRVHEYENPITGAIVNTAVCAGLMCVSAFIANRFGLDVNYGFAAATGAAVGLLDAYRSFSSGKRWHDRLMQDG